MGRVGYFTSAAYAAAAHDNEAQRSRHRSGRATLIIVRRGHPLLHWAVFLLFAYQYIGANIMSRIGQGKTLFWLNQDDYYNWHKSIGLVLLALVVLRIAWRKLTALPDWAPTLTPAERTISHWNETMLYTCMFLMPVSGYLFVMAGDYGVRLFGRYDLPNPIGKQEWLATLAQVPTSSPRTRSSSSRPGMWAWVSSTIFSTATAFSTACCRSAGADEEDVCPWRDGCLLQGQREEPATAHFAVSRRHLPNWPLAAARQNDVPCPAGSANPRQSGRGFPQRHVEPVFAEAIGARGSG